MAYQLSTVRDRVQAKLDDTNFSASKINQFINDAQRDIFNTYDFPFNQGIDLTKVLALDGTSVTLPTDFQRMRVLETISPSGYEMALTPFSMNYTTFKNIYPYDADRSSGTPSFWTVYGNELLFAWKADKQYGLGMYYTKTADELVNDTDVPEIPEAFSETLVVGAYIRALEHNDDNDIADYQRTRYYVPQMQNMMNRYSPRAYGKTPRIRNSRRGI